MIRPEVPLSIQNEWDENSSMHLCANLHVGMQEEIYFSVYLKSLDKLFSSKIYWKFCSVLRFYGLVEPIISRPRNVLVSFHSYSLFHSHSHSHFPLPRGNICLVHTNHFLCMFRLSQLCRASCFCIRAFCNHKLWEKRIWVFVNF